VTFDGNSDFTVPRLAIGQYDGFADKLGLRLLEFGKNFRRVSFRGRHRGARDISMIAAVAKLLPVHQPMLVT